MIKYHGSGAFYGEGLHGIAISRCGIANANGGIKAVNINFFVLA